VSLVGWLVGCKSVGYVGYHKCMPTCWSLVGWLVVHARALWPFCQITLTSFVFIAMSRFHIVVINSAAERPTRR